MKSVQQTQANWKASAPRAATDWTAGINGYTGDWAGATTRQQALMLANVTESITSGRWSSAVSAVGTQGWKAAATSQAAASNYSNGFNKGEANYNAAAAKFMPAIANGVSGLSPRGDIFANLDRSRALALYLHGLKGSLGAR